MDAKNEYLRLFRGKEWWSNLEAAELQKTMNQVKAWFDRLTESGQLKAAQPARARGRHCFGQNRAGGGRRAVR